jgi:site-specific DNA-methyltransferase (adenine-specific)
MADLQILIGDCRESMRSLEAGSVQSCVTSPPYFGLRDYGMDGQLGLEPSPADFVAALVEVFREVYRVLADDGTLWLNLGDCYLAKQRQLIPARVALALQADGWILRDEIVWHKPRATPAPVKDRTCAAHEMLFLFAKNAKYYYDYAAIEEPAKYAGKVVHNVRGQAPPTQGDATKYAGRSVTVKDTRRKRSVWSISPSPYKQAHFATFPPDLIEPCILAGSRSGDTILDPFGGSGTTAGVAIKHGRKAILCELNPEYAALVPNRIAHIAGEGWDLI